MTLQPAPPPERTYLVECFGPDHPKRRDRGFLATLAIAADEQLLVLVRDADAVAARRRCLEAGLSVDRVVEVTLSPAWRWSEPEPGPRRRARGSPR